MEHFWTVLFHLLLLVFSVKADEYIVTPINDDGCIDESLECHDLRYYTSNSDIYFTSDTTLTFLPGTHILDYNGPVVISGVSNLTLQGDGDAASRELPQTSVVIVIYCSRAQSGFLFRDFDGVTVSGLTIVNCGYNLTKDLVSYISDNYFENRFSWNYTVSLQAYMSLLFLNGTNANIFELSMQNSAGYGLTMVNVFGIDISTSWFTRSNYVCYNDSITDEYIFGGNIRIVYIDSTQCPEAVPATSTVLLNSVYVYRGSNCGVYYGNILQYDPFQSGGGLAIMTNSYQCSRVELDIRRLRALNNKGRFGANILLFGLPVTTFFSDLICAYGQRGTQGSGLSVWVTQEPPSDWNSTFTIQGGLFVSNGHSTSTSFGPGVGSALYMSIYTESFYTNVSFYYCEFRFNHGVSVVQIAKQIPYTMQRLNLNLNLTVINGSDYNRNPYPVSPFDFTGGLVLVNTHCFASRLYVINNNYTGIELLASVLQFSGFNLIQNNTHTNGGGMKILRNSQINLYSPNSTNTTVQFINNRAREYGGAIYVPVRSSNDLTYDQPCFIQVVGSSELNVEIYVENNTAGITGEFLSGGNLGTCFITGNTQYSFRYNFFDFLNVDESTLGFLYSLIQLPMEPGTDLYFICSPPVAVFFCNGSSNRPLVNEFRHPVLELWQGYYYNVSLAIIGDTYCLTPGNVTIIVQNCTDNTYTNCTDLLGQSTSVELEAKCSNVPISVNGSRYSNWFRVRMNSGTNIYTLIYPNLPLNILSMECPIGFIKEDICDCNEFIQEYGGACDINTQMITLDGVGWVGFDRNSWASNEYTQSALYSDDCPQDYCNTSSVTFNILDSPDDQCAHNRAGILCGGCADGYSLLLGSNECGECPNNDYLSLLLVFGIAGIALVILLILLNLTVSVGTINGLIFYANIVKILEDVFFTRGGNNPIILRQFIAFLNLDFGFQVCFAEGLTPYVKTWLQFLFPFYIWFIMIIIMLLCRRFTRLAELIGNNAVKVLATLLLLSYTKLIRAITVSLGTAMIHSQQVYTFQQVYNEGDYSEDFPENFYQNISKYYFENYTEASHSILVWSNDGSLKYSSPEVVTLVIFNIIVLLVLVLPYSLILFTLPVCGRILALINWSSLSLRLRPFIDAYAAPFKKSDQFWVGLLLFIRVLIGMVKSISEDNQLSLFVVIFIIMALLVMALDLQGPYEKVYLNVIESWFLVNLLGLCILNLGAVDDAVKYGSTIVSVSLALITFTGIIALHIYWLVKRYPMIYRNWVSKRKNTGDPTPMATNDLSVSVNSGDMVKSSVNSGDMEMVKSSESAAPPTKSVISVAPQNKGRSRFDKFRESFLEVLDNDKDK